jgi:hypothetical protein
MAGLVPATHFPESHPFLHRLWKMDGRHKGGHDEMGIQFIPKSLHSFLKNPVVLKQRRLTTRRSI